MFWTALNPFLDQLRPRRQLVVLLVDALLILLAWHATYLFRMGVERWLHERPHYDWAVLLGVVAVYSALSWALDVPRASWRYTSFSDITRLAVVCLGAGLACAVIVLMAQLVEVPRAVLGLHPVITLMGLSVARIAVRMAHEQARARLVVAGELAKRAVGFDIKEDVVGGAALDKLEALIRHSNRDA